MSKYGRYLFGWSKADNLRVKIALDVGQYIDLEQQTSAPAAKAGRIYWDGTNAKLCSDGTNWSSISTT